MAKDYYSILGVSRSASADEIKKAYRKMSKELHPDKHKGDKGAETKFKDVNEAYEALSDPKKRQMYDQFGSTGPGGGGFGGGAGGGFGGFDFSGFGGGNGERMDFSDLFENFFGGGGAAAGARGHNTSNDTEAAIQIPFMDVVLGRDVVIRHKKFMTCVQCDGKGAEPGTSLVTCSECRGTGQTTRTTQSLFGTMQQTILCPRCKGSGKIPEKPCRTCTGEGRVQESTETSVHVPAGLDDGQTLRVRGQGHAGRRGEPPGDFYVHVTVLPDPRFERQGADIRTRLELPVTDAVLGAEAKVTTVHGDVTLDIPAGTQPGQVLRMRGKGMPVLQTPNKGDHYVTVDVKIPTKLSREERKLVEEWRKLQN